MFYFNWSNFLNLANSPSCFVIYSRWRKAFLGDKHLPNIVLCFLRRLLLGNGELLYSSFKGLESMAVPQVLICISSISPMLGFIYLLYRKSRSNENFLKLERMRQRQHNVALLNDCGSKEVRHEGLKSPVIYLHH